MKLAIVCSDKECLPLASNMFDAFCKHTGNEMQFVSNARSEVSSNIDFFFIWNFHEIGSNVLGKLKAHPPDLKCPDCGHNFSTHQYKSYRTGIENCPKCNARPSLSSNFIHIGHATKSFFRQHDFDCIKDGQLMARHWISAWTNNQMFTTFIQAITYVPHVMISGKASNLGQFLIIKNKNNPLTQEVIDAMSMGTLVFGNVSSYVLSFYPDFPITPIHSKGEPYTIHRFCKHSNVEQARNATKVFARKHFSQKKVTRQWEFLAKFILNPMCRHDSPLQIEETDILPYPLYWGLQGGYGKNRI